MFGSTQVLIIAHEPELLGHVYSSPTLEGHEITTVAKTDDPVEKVRAGLDPKLILIDVDSESTRNRLETLQQLKITRPQAKLVAICGARNARVAVEAMRMGALECLVKPFTRSEFEMVIARCLVSMPAVAATKHTSEIEDVGEGRFLVTSSPSMRKIRSYCGLAAKADFPVLILGESGTGKEVVARLIHKISSRRNCPFLKINCAAMPADLLESELFGYEPGAFTGANTSKPGKFEQANKGTILLDEIGEMHPVLQAKLLHVLQDHQFSRLGGRTTINVDVRVLAATNIDIQDALTTRKLREDLYYRLNTFVVRMPALRERKDEIEVLLRHFTTHQAKEWNIEPLELSSTLIDTCNRYPWPGNVRELENFAKRLLIIRDEAAVTAELTLPSALAPVIPIAHRTSSSTPFRGEHTTDSSIANLKSVARSALGEAESVAIAEALAHTRWNRKRAAELLDISYKALLYKIKQYDLGRTLSQTGS